MSNTRVKRPRYTETDVSLIALAEQLSLPIKTVLYLSSEGYLPLFVGTKPKGAQIVSVHKDLISPHGADQPPLVIALASRPTIGVTSLDAKGVIGFFLSEDDCLELMLKGKLTQSLFPTAIKQHFNNRHLNWVLPRATFFPSTRIPELSPVGWRVACYPKETVFGLSAESGYPSPISIRITLSKLYARTEDILRFLDTIDSNDFLDDLITTKKNVVNQKPVYISNKLKYLIKTSESVWRTEYPIKPGDYRTHQGKVRQALQEPEFLKYFGKDRKLKGVREAASRFIKPIFARPKVSDAMKQDWNGHLTPELLTLMAASKLYWSSPHVDLNSVITHPSNKEIEDYLRIRGITGNDADFAITLIRPEGAIRGRPVAEPSIRRRLVPRPISHLVSSIHP